MHIKKNRGGSAIRWRDGREYSWPEDGSVCEVPDELGLDLLRLDPGEYTRVEPPRPAPKAAATKAAAPEAAKPAAPASAGR
jgi:hypothetical protein